MRVKNTYRYCCDEEYSSILSANIIEIMQAKMIHYKGLKVAHSLN